MNVKLDYIRDLPGFSRGHPHYQQLPVIDHLLEIVLQLGAEIWVNRDRQFVIEHLLTTQGKVTSEMIETFEPDDAFQAMLDHERNEFTQRAFGCLYDGLDDDMKDTFVPGTINKKKT